MRCEKDSETKKFKEQIEKTSKNLSFGNFCPKYPIFNTLWGVKWSWKIYNASPIILLIFLQFAKKIDFWEFVFKRDQYFVGSCSRVCNMKYSKYTLFLVSRRSRWRPKDSRVCVHTYVRHMVSRKPFITFFWNFAVS